jgi:hypothetical protein
MAPVVRDGHLLWLVVYNSQQIVPFNWQDRKKRVFVMLKSCERTDSVTRLLTFRDDEGRRSLPSRKAAVANHISYLAQRRLQASAYSELREVKCSLQDGTLVLDGTVSSFYLKQLAQTALREMVERLPQVRRIENRLQVPSRSN